MNIEEFYEENPTRRSSEEFEFGRDWSDTKGRRGEVSWIHDTGELYLMSAPVEPIVADAAGGEHLQRLPAKAVTVEVLRTIPRLDQVETLLEGWAAAMPQPDSLRWLRDRLATTSTTSAPDAEAPAVAADEEPVEIPGARADGASFMITTLIDRLHAALPDAEQPRLAPYRQRAAHAGSDKTTEWHRAFRCARWAVEVVSQPAHHELARDAQRALEVVREIKDALGAEILDLEALPFGQAVSPRFELELAWVEEAARVAEHVAAKSGWDAVPWEALLRNLLAKSPRR